uniref:beta strand repeat-containing protein n=1 Tax=Flavobacterium sp. TaxID=239 RepID=UPI0040472706
MGAGGAGGRTGNNTDRNGGPGGDGQIKITYTSSIASYCLQSFSTVEPITNVTFAGINNTTSNVVNGTPQLESFCDIASVQQGTSYPISLKGNTDGNFTDNFRVYIDWDQNGVFGNVANEIYDIGVITNSTGVDAITLTGTIAVPIAATLGNTKMRVIKNFNAYTGPCATNSFGQAEDYLVNITASAPPTITSLGAASGCIGSTLVINGTNLSSTSAVTIGGTAATITATTSTTVTVTVGSGTTGTVQVTTPSGSATSAATFTVNPNPAAIGGGSSTVCVGGTTPAFTNATAGGTWSITNGSGSATIAPTGIVTGVTAGTATVVYTLPTTCSITRAITINGVPATVTTPTPTNGATGVCYAGGGAVSSISWAAAAGATSYDVYFGAGSVPVTVTANVATNTYNTGALIASTTYYWRVVAKNACGDAITSATFSFTTAATTCTLSYCTAGGSNPASSYISNVTLNTINQSNSVWAGYRDYFPTVSTNVMRTLTYTISVTIYNATTSQKDISAWIDWNQNGVFDIASETVLSTTSIVATAQSVTLNNNFTVPVGAALDPTRLRVELSFNGQGAAAPCNTNTLTDVQDYKVIVNPAVPCVTPTAQPTALVLTPSGNFISGLFAPAVPSADNYLIVMNTTNVAPTPVSGTTYVIGNTIGAGNTVVGIGSGTTFVATGLTPTTTYYFFVYSYSYNSVCTGGPLYNTTSPLNGTSTTTTADPVYCTPSVGVGYEALTYFTNISFVGTLNDVSNNSTYSSTPRGYENFTTLPNVSRQAQGEGVNIATQTSNRGYLKAWVDWNRDGDFLDAGELVYDVGGITSYSTTFGFVIPAAQPVGNYRVRIRINKDDNTPPYDPGAISVFDACQNIDYYGETEDYLFTVVASCSANITAVFDGENCGAGSVVIGATGTGSPTEYRWYSTEFGGIPLATTATGTWTTPSIATTTMYWVTAFNGCESLTRSKVTAVISPLATLSFTPSVPEVCGENNVLSLTATGDKQLTYLVNEPFNSGLGVMSNSNIVSNGGATDALTQWQNRTSTFVPAQQVWFPAIASGLGGNGFAAATSDVGAVVTHNYIQSPILNTTSYLNLTMSFDIYYSRYYVDETSLTLDYVTVDVSTNGGAAWTELTRYTADIGYGTRFVNKTFNLDAYTNQTNLRVRVRYYGEWCDGLAVDNFKVFGDVPLSTSFDWTSATPVAAFQDFACTIPYVSGTPITTVFIKPTLAQLEESTYDFTATATLSNGCDISQDISIDNKSKVWKGGTSNDWDNPNNWLPLGIPDANTCVIIPSAFNTSNILGTNYNAFGKTLQVKNGGTLTIHPSNNVTITDFVEVTPGGVFTIENSGSLIQVNNIANTGTISMKRNVNVRKLDYVYWSSPVANYALNNISTTMYRYKWIPTIVANTNGWGNWSLANENMVNGKGYIVRGPDSFTATPQNYTQNFVGVPNNGIINMPISRGTYDGANYSTGVSGTLATNNDDNWNLIGNPYPSAISANTFLATNTNIAGFIKFWTHSNLPSSLISDPFYSDFVQNYTVSDYVTYNATGANPPVGNGNIGAGQGFFVLMNHSSAGTDENVVFDNTMRRNDYRNDLFFRNGNVANSNSEEKNRIWLNLVSPTSKSSSTLVGYLTSATDDLDRMFDAPALDVKTNFELYSFSNTDKLTIQGKGLPFNNEDQIPLGISISESGNHTIGISKVDGLFENENQNIYLEDLTLGIIHNLRTSPYSFTATTGRFENRFILKFNNATLGNEDYIANSVIVYTNEDININASNKIIKSVKIHDLLGRVIGIFNNVNSNTFTTSKISKTQTTLLIEVTLDNGATETYKVIF